MTPTFTIAYNPYVKGIYCQRCNRKRNEIVCPRCGYPYVYIHFEFQGEKFNLYYDQNGKVYTYSTAEVDKRKIDHERDEDHFRSEDWRVKDSKERLFETAFKRFLEQKEKKLHPGTLHVYQSYYDNHFKLLYASGVREIRLKHLQLWYDGLPRNLTSKYKKNMTDCLRAFFNWLVRWGDIKTCPIMPDIETPDSIPRTALEYDVQRSELKKIPEPFRDFFEFLMETGLRPAEGCALQIGDYHPTLHKILVQRTYSRNQLIETTKGKNRTWRTLSTRANELILSAIGNEIDAKRFIFINPATGRGYLAELCRKMWRKYTDVAEDLYASTRHSLGTQLAEMGAEKIYIKEILGHKDGRSTDVYMHPTDRKKKEYLDSIGKVVDIKRKKAE